MCCFPKLRRTADDGPPSAAKIELNSCYRHVSMKVGLRCSHLLAVHVPSTQENLATRARRRFNFPVSLQGVVGFLNRMFYETPQEKACIEKGTTIGLTLQYQTMGHRAFRKSSNRACAALYLGGQKTHAEQIMCVNL